MDTYLSTLTTESVNQQTVNIDECGTEKMLRLINEQDRLVPAAVEKEIPHIAQATEVVYQALTNGGRMFYIGAGTSGRLGILDASECPPTYGTDPELVQAYIAGGDSALRSAAEGCEDNWDAGAQLIDRCHVTSADVVVGITASGSAAFVLAAVTRAKELGAATLGLVCNQNTKLSKLCDICIAPVVGPEVVIGSTRMKAGTAQKLVLNMLTTSVMIKLGKVYGNLMVDLKATNKKLYDRAKRIIAYATDADDQTCERYLQLSGNNTKLAIMMILTGLDAGQAETVLAQNGFQLKKAVQSVRQA